MDVQEGGFAGTATRHAGVAVKPSQRGGFYGLRPLPPAPLLTSAPFFGGHVDSQLLVLITVWLLVLCLAHVLFETT